jgi:phage tail sheath gpL-like
MGNPNLTSGQMLPGYYGYVDYNVGGPAQSPNRRCLLIGFGGASATQTPNRPFRPNDMNDAIGKAGGANVDLVRMYAAALAQPEAADADIFLLLIQPTAGGTASTYKLKVYVSNTNPAKAGVLQLFVASQQIGAVGFTTTDTATTIGDSIVTQLLAQSRIPILSAVNAAGVVTITYIHKGTTGEDLPIRAGIQPIGGGTGVSLSPCQLLFATNATGAGSVVVNIGAKTITTALAGAETPAQIAAKVAASFAADTYPCQAVVDGSVAAQVNLIFNDGWDVRRISAAIVSSTGTTVNAGSGVTDGTGSATSLSYNGTVGVGAPVLTQAITNLQGAKEWYRSWAQPWVDTATISTIAAYLESGQDGSITGQKLQVLTFGDPRALSVAGAVPPAVSPNLTTTPPHYAEGWPLDAPVQAFELAARVAVAKAAKWIDTPQFNWNGWQFQGNELAPILAPSYTPSELTQNTALRTYALSPWILGPSGNIEVVKGRTTSLNSDLRLWAWSAEAQAANHIQDLQLYYPKIFQGGSIVRFSEPKAPKIFDSNSFEDVTRARMKKWEKAGHYDGAELLGPAVKAVPNPVNPFRMDVDYPESPVLDLDQIVFTSHFTQPSQ